MRFVYFAHSLTCCWNHGNAHFLRGVLRDLLARGHEVRCFEPPDGHNHADMRAEPACDAYEPFERLFADLAPHAHYLQPDIDAMLDGADVVLVHEWNDPELIQAIGRRRKHGGRFVLLFHDTHLRAIEDPDSIRSVDLSGYDGVLAFAAALADVYCRAGWASRAFLWREAADVRLFHPPARERRRRGAVWIGDWNDGEASLDRHSYVFEPAAGAGIPLHVYGARYPDRARAALAAAGVDYLGWLPNAAAPAAYARHLMTVHVPPRECGAAGVTSIRAFEALACGIPLICGPRHDSDTPFRAGVDFLSARHPGEMREHMRSLQADAGMRRALAAHGWQTILANHTCAHRVAELMAIVERLTIQRLEAA